MKKVWILCCMAALAAPGAQAKSASAPSLYSAVPKAWADALRAFLPRLQAGPQSLANLTLRSVLASDLDDPGVRAGLAPVVRELEARGLSPKTVAYRQLEAAEAAAQKAVTQELDLILLLAQDAEQGQPGLRQAVIALSLLQGPWAGYLPDGGAGAAAAYRQARSRLSEAQQDRVDDALWRIAKGHDAQREMEDLAEQDRARAAHERQTAKLLEHRGRLRDAAPAPRKASAALKPRPWTEIAKESAFYASENDLKAVFSAHDDNLGGRAWLSELEKKAPELARRLESLTGKYGVKTTGKFYALLNEEYFGARKRLFVNKDPDTVVVLGPDYGNNEGVFSRGPVVVMDAQTIGPVISQALLLVDGKAFPKAAIRGAPLLIDSRGTLLQLKLPTGIEAEVLAASWLRHGRAIYVKDGEIDERLSGSADNVPQRAPQDAGIARRLARLRARPGVDLSARSSVLLDREFPAGPDFVNRDPDTLVVLGPRYRTRAGLYSAGPVVLLGAQALGDVVSKRAVLLDQDARARGKLRGYPLLIEALADVRRARISGAPEENNCEPPTQAQKEDEAARYARKSEVEDVLKWHKDNLAAGMSWAQFIKVRDTDVGARWAALQKRHPSALVVDRFVVLNEEHLGERATLFINKDPRAAVILGPDYRNHRGLFSAGPILLLGARDQGDVVSKAAVIVGPGSAPSGRLRGSPLLIDDLADVADALIPDGIKPQALGPAAR